MSVRPGATLYSHELLGLAIELAGFPYDPAAPLQGEATSRVCGSRVLVSAHLAEGRLTRLGLRVTACAVGQAAAAILAGGLPATPVAALAVAQSAIARWLEGDGPIPDWPRIEALAPALAYPARHAAILLPWRAAGDALSKAGAPG